MLFLSALLIFSCGKKETIKETSATVETSKKIVETTAKPVETKREINPDIKVKTEEVDKKTGLNVVKFGTYDKEVGFSDSIEWLVVDRNVDSYLLVSRYILDCKNYNNSDKEVTWENSNLNEWLNNYFLNSAFSSDEIAYMNYPKEFKLDGNAKITLLNIKSCEKYFGLEDTEKRNFKLSAKATSWAKTNFEETVEVKNSDYYDCGSFFLTDNGTTNRKAAWVGQYGHIYIEGQSVKLEHGDGVRPVIAVKKELFATEQKVPTYEEEEETLDVEESVAEEQSDEYDETYADTDESETVEETTKKKSGYSVSTTIYSNISKEKFQSDTVPISEKKVVDTKNWEYGRTPIDWIYVGPNKQIISNTSPNRSANYSYKVGASSGSRGCYMTIFSKGECYGDDWDGRLYCFEDYTKAIPEEIKFDVKFDDLKYGDYSVKELLERKYVLEKLSDGIVKANGTYINIIYVSELDEIIKDTE